MEMQRVLEHGPECKKWRPTGLQQEIDNHSHCDLVSRLSSIHKQAMYVCLCNGITESQIRDAVGEGARSLSELHLCLGVASCCGKCADGAQQVLHESISSGQSPSEHLNAA
jgi:bacterioferritin-associated ferredoxin